jgi:hypothetical protein
MQSATEISILDKAASTYEEQGIMAPLYTLIPLKERKVGRLSCCTTDTLLEEFVLLLEKGHKRKVVISAVSATWAEK